MNESNGGHESFGPGVFQVMEELGMVGIYAAGRMTIGEADQEWLDSQNGTGNKVEGTNEQS